MPRWVSGESSGGDRRAEGARQRRACRSGRRRASAPSRRCRRPRRRRTWRPWRPAPGCRCRPRPAGGGRSSVAARPRAPRPSSRARRELPSRRRSPRSRRSRVREPRSPRDAPTRTPAPRAARRRSPGPSMRRRTASASSTGRSGTITPDTPASTASSQEPVHAPTQHGVHVGHHGHRHVERRLADGLEHRDRPSAGLERGGRRPLDHASVHDRVGMGYADLDRVGAELGHRPQQRRVDPREPAGQVGHERRPSRVTPSPQGGFQPAHQARDREGGEHGVEILVTAAGEADQHARALGKRAVQEPADHVRGLERGQDALGAGEGLEAHERIVVGGAHVLREAGVGQPCMLGADPRVVQPGRDRVGLRRSGRRRPGAGSSSRRAARPAGPA